MAADYCRRHGLTLAADATYKDLAVSGHTGDQLEGRLGDLLEDVKAGKIKRGTVLLIEAVDRLSRMNPYDALDIFKKITKAGIDVITLEDEMVYTYDNIENTIWQLINKITGAYAFSKRLSRRISDVWTKKKQLAASDHKPHGKTVVSWLRLSADGTRYEVIPERGAIVQRIFNEHAAGDGKDKIVRRFNEEGVPPFTRDVQGIFPKPAKDGKVRKRKAEPERWYASTVHKILTNRAVLGEYQPTIKNADNKRAFKERQKERLEQRRAGIKRSPANDGHSVPDGPPIIGYYPQIIEYSLWCAATEARAMRDKSGGPKGYHLNNLLSGVCKCAYCGSTMIFRDKGARKYLECFGRLGGTCSAKGMMRYDVVESAVLTRLAVLDTEGKLKNKPPSSSDAEEESRIRFALDAAEARLETLMNGEVTEQMRKIMVKQSATIAGLEAELQTVRERIAKANAAVPMEAHAAALRELQALCVGGDYSARLRVRTALRSLISNIDIDVVKKHAEVYCANDFIFIIYANGYTMDIETGGGAETMGRTFTINKYTEDPM